MLQSIILLVSLWSEFDKPEYVNPQQSFRYEESIYTPSSFYSGRGQKTTPYGLGTTGNLMLEFMSRSKDEQQRDTAAFIKASKKMPEMVMVFDFAMSLLKHDVIPIRESIYDTGIDGIKELNDHLADKYGIDENHKGNAKAYNFFNWLVLRLPAKEEMKKFGLIL